jgi:hypothetical protein
MMIYPEYCFIDRPTLLECGIFELKGPFPPRGPTHSFTLMPLYVVMMLFSFHRLDLSLYEFSYRVLSSFCMIGIEGEAEGEVAW